MSQSNLYGKPGEVKPSPDPVRVVSGSYEAPGSNYVTGHRCLSCGVFHSIRNPYRCAAEIDSHSDSTWQGPHRETCDCRPCVNGRFERWRAGFKVQPALSPIFEEAMDQLEAMEQLRNAGAIR